MATQAFIEKFRVPQAALDVVDGMIPPMEQEFLLRVPPDTVFAPDEALPWLGAAAGRDIDIDEATALLRRAYERGVLDMLGKSLTWEETGTLPAGDCDEPPPDGQERERYKLADFYGFLDVFAVTEPALWALIPAETRRALDEGYLARYVAGIEQSGAKPITTDEIRPMDEVISSILADPRPIYLSECDCMALQDGVPQEFPKRCLSYRTAPGSYASRGISRRITREEAAEVVREADRRGLIHTINPNAICNCGPGWCYLFRGRERLGTGHEWPKENYRVRLLEGCTSCGICVKRCPFGALTLADGGLRADEDRCVGCGLCVNTCPAKALGLEAK